MGMTIFLLMSAIPFLNGMGLDSHPVDREKMFLAAERQFFKRVEQRGIIDALMFHLSADGVVLPRSGHPIMGKQAFGEIMSGHPGPGPCRISSLENLKSGLSGSGDLGYCLGRFRFGTSRTSEVKEKRHGYFGMVWRKKKNGPWKLVFVHGLLLKTTTNEPPDDLISGRRLTPVERSLVDAERAFSRAAVKNGIAPAFFRFIDKNGIVLNPGGPLDRNAYRKLSSQKPEKGWDKKLSWRPIFTRVSRSGDLGYNFGPYQLTITKPDGTPESRSGYFFTVWKKKADGSWKFVLDGGNHLN